MGTVELTGLQMMSMCAFGETFAAALAKSRTIEALVLNKSSRVIPGLRGTPAGMTMISAPSNAFSKPPSGPSGENPVVLLREREVQSTLMYLT